MQKSIYIIVLLMLIGCSKNIQPEKLTKTQSPVELATASAVETLMNAIEQNSKVAIINVTSDDKDMAEFVVAEVEHILLKNKFLVVDRRDIDAIRKEQNFQLSGEVDDATAVEIGKFIGAGVIISGEITGSGTLRRLRLRARDTQTARVLAAPSEKF